jgi:hypothetical protein
VVRDSSFDQNGLSRSTQDEEGLPKEPLFLLGDEVGRCSLFNRRPSDSQHCSTTHSDSHRTWSAVSSFPSPLLSSSQYPSFTSLSSFDEVKSYSTFLFHNTVEEVRNLNQVQPFAPKGVLPCKEEPIDIVYTWVNGSDPRHRASVEAEKRRHDPHGRTFEILSSSSSSSSTMLSPRS